MSAAFAPGSVGSSGSDPSPSRSPNPSPSARGAGSGAPLRNVLYLMVDDLRSQLGCYGHNDTVSTPNVDRLAAEGALFQHAYVQIAVCSPSRSSYLTGLRPEQNNILNFRTDFRRATSAGPSIVTLPQWFKAVGYTASGMGKTFHPGLPPSYDEPHSWTQPEAGGFPYFTANNDTGDFGCGGGLSPWCSEAVGVAPDEYTDGQLVGEAMRQLRIIAARDAATPPPSQPYANPLSRPFFMAVGLHRPHMDWIVPPEFLAKQPPPSEIALARHPVVPEETAAAAWAFYNCTELTGRARLAKVGAHIEATAALPTALAQNVRRQYYSAVEYMDSQVGRVLGALDELKLTDSTVTVFHGDHGTRPASHRRVCWLGAFSADRTLRALRLEAW